MDDPVGAPQLDAWGASVSGTWTERNEGWTVPDMSSDLPIIIFTLLATIVPWFMLAYFGIDPVRVADESAPGRLSNGGPAPLSQTQADGRDASSTSAGEAPATFASDTAADGVRVGSPAHAG